MEAQLRRALARDELELHYQSKQDIATGGVTGMEALLRWKHPELGMVSPASSFLWRRSPDSSFPSANGYCKPRVRKPLCYAAGRAADTAGGGQSLRASVRRGTV
jgi:hypothetical protein